MICVKARIAKNFKYYVIHITRLVKAGILRINRLYNVYIYTDLQMSKLIFFETRKVSRLSNGSYIVRLFNTKRHPLLHRTNIIACFEDVAKYTRHM